MSRIVKKTILWIFVILLIIITSIGVHLTHPIRNYNLIELQIWVVLSLVILPVSFTIHNYIRNIVLENRFKDKKKETIESKHSFGDASYFDILPTNGCLPSIASGDGILFIFILIGGIAAFLSGIVFGVLLAGIEFLLEQILNLDQKPFEQAHWLVYVVNGLCILCSTYFISLFIAIHFFS